MIAIASEVPKKKATQKDRIKAHLLSGKSITPVECFERGWGMRLAAIIHTLRNEGMSIETQSETSRFGHKYAKYKVVQVESVMFREKLNKLRLLLNIYGYKRHTIKQLDGSNEWTLIVGYWDTLTDEHELKLLTNVSLLLVLDSFEDKDTGKKWFYKIIDK